MFDFRAATQQMFSLMLIKKTAATPQSEMEMKLLDVSKSIPLVKLKHSRPIKRCSMKKKNKQIV